MSGLGHSRRFGMSRDVRFVGNFGHTVSWVGGCAPAGRREGVQRCAGCRASRWLDKSFVVRNHRSNAMWVHVAITRLPAQGMMTELSSAMVA
jgi:hypothetical protein